MYIVIWYLMRTHSNEHISCMQWSIVTGFTCLPPIFYNTSDCYNVLLLSMICESHQICLNHMHAKYMLFKSKVELTRYISLLPACFVHRSGFGLFNLTLLVVDFWKHQLMHIPCFSVILSLDLFWKSSFTKYINIFENWFSIKYVHQWGYIINSVEI